MGARARTPKHDPRLEKLATKWHNVAGDGDDGAAFVRVRSGPRGARRVVGRIPLPYEGGAARLLAELHEWREKQAGEACYFEVMYTGETTPEDSCQVVALPADDDGNEVTDPGSFGGRGSGGELAYMAAQLGRRNDAEVERLTERNNLLEGQNHTLLMKIAELSAEAAANGILVDLYDQGMLGGDGSGAAMNAVGPLIKQAMEGFQAKRGRKGPAAKDDGKQETADEAMDRIIREVQAIGMTSPAVLVARLDILRGLYCKVCEVGGVDPRAGL